MNTFVIQVAQSGSERAVVQLIQKSLPKLGLDHAVRNVFAPIKTVETADGKIKEEVLLPGYVFITMEKNAKAFATISKLPKVWGFLTDGRRPLPVEDCDLARFMDAKKLA